jgi:hypothetical protein
MLKYLVKLIKIFSIDFEVSFLDDSNNKYNSINLSWEF